VGMLVEVQHLMKTDLSDSGPYRIPNLRCAAFGDVENLAVVKTEMLDHLIHRIQAGDVIALNIKWREQICFSQAGKNL